MGSNNAKLVRKYHSYWRYRGHRVVQTVTLRRWLRKNFRIATNGQDNLAQLADYRSFIIMANHQSHLDAPLIIGSLPSKLSARVAVGAASDYFFKSYLQSKPTRILLNTFPIERSSGSRSHRGLSADLVKSGVPILVFPEGTRSRDGKLGKFHTGLARIAIETSSPILPICLFDTNLAWPVGRKQPLPGQPSVAITFLPLIQPQANETAEQLTRRIKKVIQAGLDGNR